MTGPEVTQNEKLTEAGATADEPAIPVARALTPLAAGPMLTQVTQFEQYFRDFGDSFRRKS